MPQRWRRASAQPRVSPPCRPRGRLRDRPRGRTHAGRDPQVLPRAGRWGPCPSRSDAAGHAL